jgi:N-acetylglutamate synthase-like GNAT family acetyltransferase
MIRAATEDEIEIIADVINDGAGAYKGVIPADQWQEPYMPRGHLEAEIAAGVTFWVTEDDGEVVGVMGVQDVKDVTLIRHAYVRTAARRSGIGSALLAFLQDRTTRPLLIGTWADAVWAVDFYQKHGFRLIEGADKDALLDAYWTIPDRQRDTSVVLADRRWFARDG